MRNLGKLIFRTSMIVSYALATIVIVQLLRKIFGGSWGVEDLILTLVSINLTLTFSSLIYFNNKMSGVASKLHGHIEWHKGRDSKANL